MVKSRATGYGYDHDVLRAANRWQQARMAMVKADVKADNHELRKELGRAEDALSAAVKAYEVDPTLNATAEGGE